MAQNLIQKEDSIINDGIRAYNNRKSIKTINNRILFPYCVRPNALILSVNANDHTDYTMNAISSLDPGRVITGLPQAGRSFWDRDYSRFAFRKGKESTNRIYLWGAAREIFKISVSQYAVYPYMVWISDDNGVTWSAPIEIWYPTVNMGEVNPKGYHGDFVIDDNLHLYSLMRTDDYPVLYRSTDDGSTWSPMNNPTGSSAGIFAQTVAMEYNEKTKKIVMASGYTTDGGTVRYTLYDPVLNNYSPIIHFPTGSYDEISTDWTGSWLKVESIDVDNDGMTWFFVSNDFGNGRMLAMHSMSLNDTIPSEARIPFIGAGERLETSDIQGRVDSDGHIHQFITVSSSFYTSVDLAPFTESVISDWDNNLSYGEQYVGLPRDTRQTGSGEIIMWFAGISTTGSTGLYLMTDNLFTSSIVIPFNYRENFTGSLTMTERSEFVVQLDKVSSEIDFSISSSSQSGSRIYVDAEIYSFFREPASMSLFEYRKTGSDAWSPGTVSSFQVVDLSAIPLSGKTKNVDLIWEGGIDLGATQSYDDVQLKIQFAESSSGDTTAEKIYDMSTIDFRPPIGAPILRPYPSEPYFNVKFQNGIGPIQVREHYLIELDIVNTFLTSSSGYNSIYSGDTQEGWLASGSTFPANGVVSTTSSLDTIEVTYTASFLLNKPVDTYYVRVTRDFFNF